MDSNKASISDDPKVKKALQIAIKKKLISAKDLQDAMHIGEFEALLLIYTMYVRKWIQIEPTTALKTSVSSIDHAEKVWHQENEDDESVDPEEHIKEMDALHQKLSAYRSVAIVAVIVVVILLVKQYS